MVLRGGGTRLQLGAPVRADHMLDLGGLSGVREHHVRDLTVEAWAGTTVEALNRELASHRQMLALDPPLPARATLGGVIAAGDPGIRVVPGSRPRDLLLGLSAVLADGTRIRSGGRVVKNVTGYELTKLFTGSLGTLGAITRVTMRLRAVPEASRTVVASLPVSDSVEGFADRVLAAAAAAPSPAAVAVVAPGTGLSGLPEEGGFRLAIRFEGLREEGGGVRGRCGEGCGRDTGESSRGPTRRSSGQGFGISPPWRPSGWGRWVSRFAGRRRRTCARCGGLPPSAHPLRSPVNAAPSRASRRATSTRPSKLSAASEESPPLSKPPPLVGSGTIPSSIRHRRRRSLRFRAASRRPSIPMGFWRPAGCPSDRRPFPPGRFVD